MGKEEKINSWQNATEVNPLKFLEKPFKKVEVRRFSGSPDINLLQQLPVRQEETGLFYRTPDWFIVKASEEGVPGNAIPGAEIILHSHPKRERIPDSSLPSIQDYRRTLDYRSGLATTKYFIVSPKGLTQFWALEGDKNKQKLSRILCPAEPEYLPLILKEIDAKFRVYPWETLDNKIVKRLLSTD